MAERPSDRRSKLVGTGFIVLTLILILVFLLLQHPWHDKPPHYPLPFKHSTAP